MGFCPGFLARFEWRISIGWDDHTRIARRAPLHRHVTSRKIGGRLRFLSLKSDVGNGFRGDLVCHVFWTCMPGSRDHVYGSELPKTRLLGSQAEIEDALRIDCPNRFTMEVSGDEAVSDFFCGLLRNTQDVPEARKTGEPEI